MDEEKELPEHEPENHVEDENKSAISADRSEEPRLNSSHM